MRKILSSSMQHLRVKLLLTMRVKAGAQMRDSPSKWVRLGGSGALILQLAPMPCSPSSFAKPQLDRKPTEVKAKPPCESEGWFCCSWGQNLAPRSFGSGQGRVSNKKVCNGSFRIRVGIHALCRGAAQGLCTT